MNTQAATAKAIDWKHVALVVLGATWWLLKVAFKATLWLGAALLTVVAFFLSGLGDDSDEIEGRWDHTEYNPLDITDLRNL